MSFDAFGQPLNTSEMDSESVHEGGNTVSEEGHYHVQIEQQEIVEDNEGRKLPHVKLTMNVLAGENPDQVGRKVYNRLFLAGWEDKKNGVMGPLSDGAAKGLMAFLHSFGVVGDEAFGQEEFRLTRGLFERLENTQAVIKVTKGEDRTVKNEETGEETTYKGRYEMAWSSDCWPLDHEKVKDVPKDYQAAAMAGAGSAAGDDDLSDL